MKTPLKTDNYGILSDPAQDLSDASEWVRVESGNGKGAKDKKQEIKKTRTCQYKEISFSPPGEESHQCH